MTVLPMKPIATEACAVYPWDPGVNEALTFESNYDGKVYMARRDGDRLFVPRNCAPSVGTDFRSVRPMGAISCKALPLDEDQAQAVRKSVQLLKQGVSHTVEAPTGWGKTYHGSAVAAEVGEATLIVVTKQDLMTQWYDTLVNLVGVDPGEIGTAQGKDLAYEGKRFVLGMVQSLMIPEKYDSKFWCYFGLMILDESHKMAADCFQQVCFYSRAKLRMAESATPKRPDGKTPIVDAHVGPILVRGHIVPMSPKVLVKETGWKVPEWIIENDLLMPGRMMPVYKSMMLDEKRNQVIVDFVAGSYQTGRNLVVMAEMKDHLARLQLMCGQAGIPGEDMGEYTGKFSGKKELLKLNAGKRVIFATFRMADTGTNFQQWDTLVLCVPKAHVKQAVGRILRKMPGKKTPVLLELVDKNPVLRGFHYARLKEFHEVGSKIVYLAGKPP